MKYILGVLAVILVAVIAIVFVTRPREPAQDPAEREPEINLSEEAHEGTEVIYTEQGELVGENERRAIRIRVSEDERRLEILRGYQEAVERAHTFPNTPAAYKTFLIALEELGFTDERTAEGTTDDERGACPTGKRYIFEFKKFSQSESRLWDSSCSNDGSTFGGKDSTIRRIFEKQIPNYRDLVKEVDLSP